MCNTQVSSSELIHHMNVIYELIYFQHVLNETDDRCIWKHLFFFDWISCQNRSIFMRIGITMTYSLMIEFVITSCARL